MCNEQVLREKVRALLVRHQGCDSAELEWRRLGSLFSSGTVYRVKVKFQRDGRVMESRGFLVKVSQYAHFEEQWLGLLNARLSGKAVESSIPRLIGRVEDENVIVTDYFEGASNLHQKLLRAAIVPGSGNGPADAAARTGKWLGAFQEAVHDGAKGVLAEEIADAGHRLSEIPYLGDAEKQRVIEIIEQASKELGQIPVVISHGDFAPRNVLYDENEVFVIDWEMVPHKPRPFLFDVHHFGICLSKRARGNFVKTCTRGFEEAYADSSPFKELIEPAWQPVRLVVLVTVLSRQFRATKRRPLMSRLTGKRKFMQSLCREIRRQL